VIIFSFFGIMLCDYEVYNIHAILVEEINVQKSEWEG